MFQKSVQYKQFKQLHSLQSVSYKCLYGAGAEKSSSQYQDPTLMSCINVGKQPDEDFSTKAGP